MPKAAEKMNAVPIILTDLFLKITCATNEKEKTPDAKPFQFLLYILKINHFPTLFPFQIEGLSLP